MLLSQAHSALAGQHIQSLSDSAAGGGSIGNGVSSTVGHSGIGAADLLGVGGSLGLGGVDDVIGSEDLVLVQNGDSGLGSQRGYGAALHGNTPVSAGGKDRVGRADGLTGRLVLQVHDELIVECPEAQAETAAALLKEETTGGPAGAMVLPDGRIVTGKNSSLLGPSAALLMNAIKALAGIDKDLDLLPASIIAPISDMKISHLGHHNPRLHSDEVLIALSISAVTNPLAELVLKKLDELRGCDAHFSIILSEEDTKLYNRLGIHVSCEPKYEIKKLYHK